MNGVSLVGHLADGPFYAAAVGERPARAAFSIGVPRRGSSAVDRIGVTAIAAQAEAVAGAGLPAGAVVAVSRPPTPALAAGVPKFLATTWAGAVADGGPHTTSPVATSSRWLATMSSPSLPHAAQSPGGHPMTIEFLSRLIELLTDNADYAAGVDRSAIAADLTRAADAAQLLLADERASARRAGRNRRTAVSA